MQGLTVSRLRQGLVGTMPPNAFACRREPGKPLPGRASVKGLVSRLRQGLVGTMPRANGAQKRLCD